MANIGVPDFTQATYHVNQAATEFSQQFRLLNTTPAAQLQQITAQLQQMNQQMNQQFQQLNRSVTAIDTKLSALYGSSFFLSLTHHRFPLILYRNSNTVARLQNSHAKSSEDQLMPLVDSTTGVIIEPFPRDSEAVGQMNGKIVYPITHIPYLTKYEAQQCRAMLQQLGQVVQQNQGVASLRRQIRIQIGLPADQFKVV